MVLKQQLKKNKKKGFTLVEVIVVLVIIAILAAIAVPALTGYIDKANDRQLISEARNIRVALQEIITEQYANGTPVEWKDASDLTGEYKVDGSEKGSPSIGSLVSKLVGVTYVDADITELETDGSELKTFKFTKGGKTVTYADDAYTVA
jgi:type IV pilus assembly protein PilA